MSNKQLAAILPQLKPQPRKYAYLKRRRDNDLPGIDDFSNEPRTGRLNDVLDAVFKKLPAKHYTVPKCFRS
ncbi:hypothetical protein UXP46_23565 [Enterobacter ludwigii]|uniref:hypothetical protein n=1 Tax=Enterobacter ludwigii TaxID=299767 RepID=UPI002FD3352C